MSRKLNWNTGRHYREEGQVIYIEWGFYPDRPELLIMYDLSRGVLYVYDFTGVMDAALTNYELRTQVMIAYDTNAETAKIDYQDSEYYPAENAWRHHIMTIPANDWPVKYPAMFFWFASS